MTRIQHCTVVKLNILQRPIVEYGVMHSLNIMHPLSVDYLPTIFGRIVRDGDGFVAATDTVGPVEGWTLIFRPATIL